MNDLSINDNMNSEGPVYGETDMANILPFSPADRNGPSGGDVSKNVFGLTRNLGQLFGADWDGELDAESAGAAIYVMQELSRCLDYVGHLTSVLNNALSTDKPDVQIRAANVLAKLKGVDVRPLIPVLTHAVSSDDVVCRRIAAETIGHVGPDASQLLTIVLRDSDPMVTHLGLSTVQLMGPEAACTTNALIEILVTEDGPETDEIPQINQRMDACDALRSIGQGASEAIPHLLSVINNRGSSRDDEMWLQIRAAHAHFVISGEIETCFQIALSMLDHESSETGFDETMIDTTFWLKELACDVLAEMGPSAEAAIPRLQRCLVEDPNEVVRRAAQRTLAAILQNGRKI